MSAIDNITDRLQKVNRNLGSSSQKAFNDVMSKPKKVSGLINQGTGLQRNATNIISTSGNIVARAAGTLGRAKAIGSTVVQNLGKTVSGTINNIRYAFGGSKNEKSLSRLSKSETARGVGDNGDNGVSYERTNEHKKFDGMKGFYDFFSSERMVEHVDPLVTFECRFKFYPNMVETNTYETRWGHRIVWEEGDIQDLTSENPAEMSYKKEYASSSNIIKTLVDLGIRESLRKSGENKKTKGEDLYYSQVFDRSSYDSYRVEDVIEERVIQEFQNNDFLLDFGIYIQKVTFPTIEQGGEDTQTYMGQFPVPGTIVKTSDNRFQMEVLNLEKPVIENVFYPWMREVTFPKWVYESQPYTTATITFDFTEHSNVKYHFFGCRPSQVVLIHPSQSPEQNMTRQVTFSFDFMTIETV